MYFFNIFIFQFVLTTAKPIMIKLNKEEYRKARLRLPKRIHSLPHKIPKASVFIDHDEYDKIRHIRDVNDPTQHKSMSDGQMLDHIQKLITSHKSSKVVKKQNVKLSKNKKVKITKGKSKSDVSNHGENKKEIKNTNGHSDVSICFFCSQN